jgi:hypothetical protein
MIGGVPVPLSTIAKIRTETVPETLNHFQQLNSATLSGVMAAGGAHLPQGYSVDYGGQSRQYRPGIRRLHRHVRLRAHHRVPGAGRLVRELPRSAGHSHVGADVDRRRADLHRHRREGGALNIYTQVGSGDADGADQQARHPDREFANELQQGRARPSASDREGGRHPAAPDPDDDRGHGARRRAAGHRDSGAGAASRFAWAW